MCASYGLNPNNLEYSDIVRLFDEDRAKKIRSWADQNAGAVIKPTGRLERKLLPIVRDTGLELGWWGYLQGGRPTKWASINTRSERLIEKPGGANRRALAPATHWYEFTGEKGSKTRHTLALGEPFAIAAVIQRGFPEDGEEVTCYSLVMQEAEIGIADIHDRMPLIIPGNFYDTWLDPERKGDPDLIREALAASQELTANVSVES